MPFDAGSIKAKLVVDKTQWDKSTKQIRDSQKKMTTQTKKTSMAMKGMWKQIAIGVGVTNLITMGIRGLTRQMSDTIKVGRSFEREWANVTTMLSISRTETDKLKHELRMLSPTLGDTTELAKGMYQVLSASIEPAKAIRFLGEAAKSAKAGVTDTKTAVDALTTVINAYGMEAESVTEISDIMFATVKRGKLTYGELAQSLGTVIPVAATVGINFKEVAAAVASLTRQGVVASKATMQLRQVMMAILKPSEEAKEVAEGLGISLGKMALESQGLAGWLFDLKDKTKGNADLMAKLVPNVRALTAVMALAGKAAKGYAFDQEFMKDTMGFTNEAFRKQMESMDFWIDTAEVAMDKVKIAFYEGLIFSLRESIRTTEDFDEKVTKATNDAANEVSLHVSTMVDVLGRLGKAWKATDEFMFGWIDRLRGAKEESDELAEAEKKLAEAMEKGGVKAIEVAGPIEDVGDATKYTAEMTRELGERLDAFRAIDMAGMWESLMPPSELMARWDEFYNLVETPELDLIWEQQMSSMEDDTLKFISSIIPGMKFMTTSVTKSTKTMGENTKLSFLDMAAVAGNVLTAIAEQSKGVAIAGAVISTYAAAAKTLETFGWPAAIPFMAAAILAGFKQVTAIKAQAIPSAEKGAYLPSPTIIEAGHGAKGEVILPLDRAPQFIKEMTRETTEGMRVDFNFYAPIIQTVGLSDRDLDEAAEYFLEKTKEQIERYGGKLNA